MTRRKHKDVFTPLNDKQQELYQEVLDVLGNVSWIQPLGEGMIQVEIGPLNLAISKDVEVRADVCYRGKDPEGFIKPQKGRTVKEVLEKVFSDLVSCYKFRTQEAQRALNVISKKEQE